MQIEAVDFFYFSMPTVLDIGDGSQDALLVRVQAGPYAGWAATDYQTTMASDRDWIPIQREARESMTNQEGIPPGMQQALAAISDARLGDIYHRNGQKILADVLGPTLEQLFNNNITPEEPARQIDEKANPLLQAA